MTAPLPDFRSPAFLRQHLQDTMAFYDPVATDPSGGQFHFFLDDGTVYNTHTRHLVSATRFVVTHAMLYRTTGEARYQAGMRHALQFLRTAFLDPATGGYAWLIDWQDGCATVQDATRHCYGMAFVMLAYARAYEAGVPEARAWLAEAFDTAEQHFWQPAAGLYADEASPDWQLTSYRGQNANMHACEAMISAFRATGERRYIERAEQLAQGICQRQAALSTPARPGGRGLGVGAFPRRLVGGLGLQPPRPQQHLPPLGLPSRPPDRMGQAAAATRRLAACRLAPALCAAPV